MRARLPLPFLVCLLVFGVLHAVEPRLADYDGYFHIRIASEGPMAWMGRAQPWLPFGVFAGDRWVDHQLLFHALQWPFTWFAHTPDALLNAAHASATVLSAAAVGALAWAIGRWQGGLGPLARTGWALLALGSSRFFLDRMLMPRTQALSLLWLALGVGLLRATPHRALPFFALGFAFAWSYHLAPVLVPVLALLGLALEGGLWAKLRPAALAGLGVVAGFTLHPQSPRTWEFFYTHAVVKVLNPSGQAVGAEWMPVDSRTFLLHLAPLAAAGGLLLLDAMRRPNAPRFAGRAHAWALALGWAVLATGAVKWLEYAAPFAVFALALSVPTARARSAALVAGLIGVAGLTWNIPQVLGHIRDTLPAADRLRPLAAALPPDGPCRVFHADWTDFSELVFWAPQCSYIVGLDPHFLSEGDPKRAQLVEATLAGGVERVGEMASAAFKADYVLTTSAPMEARAAADPWLTSVIAANGAHLYRVTPPSTP